LAIVVTTHSVTSGFGGPPRQAAPVNARELEVFAPFVGGAWVAALSGEGVTDTQRFEWTLGGRFVRNTHEVRAQSQVVYAGETIYAWDVRAEKIVWWYWNTTGGFVTGTLTIDADGSFTTEGENHGAKDQLDRTRSRIRFAGDSWTSQGSQEKNGSWTEQPVRTYRRVKE
jgi:hypothetical protein